MAVDSHIADVALLTPPGRGAVASLLLEGPRVGEIIDRCWAAVGGVPLTQSPVDAVLLGRWIAAPAAGEELVAVRRSDTRIELHGHGGEAVSEALLASLVERGCRRRTWREWNEQTAEDLLSAEARAALAEASTERVAAMLLDQYRGALRSEVRAVDALLAAGEAQPALARLAALLERSRLGLRLVDPWRVVLTGRPNVGKSSLINALLGYQRAIVFDRPGTTRDVLTASAALDGWPVELADTAGLRDDAWLRAPHDAIESAGIARARASMAAADLVLLVCDASQRWTEADEELMSTIAEPLVVHNKCDLPGAAGVGRPPGLAVSALTGEGLLQLIAAISRRLVPAPPAPGSPLPFTLRQVRILQAAQQAVERGDLAAARLHACLGNAGQ